MNPFEVERLGWEQIRGLPIVADPEIGTGDSGSSAHATSTVRAWRRWRRWESR